MMIAIIVVYTVVLILVKPALIACSFASKDSAVFLSLVQPSQDAEYFGSPNVDISDRRVQDTGNQITEFCA